MGRGFIYNEFENQTSWKLWGRKFLENIIFIERSNAEDFLGKYKIMTLKFIIVLSKSQDLGVGEGPDPQPLPESLTEFLNHVISNFPSESF